MKIPRGSYDDETIKPAWLPLQDSAGRACKPIIRCRCGSLVGLGLHHVHADGRVTASFYHFWPDLPSGYQQGCGFHEYVELENWTGEDFAPR